MPLHRDTIPQLDTITATSPMMARLFDGHIGQIKMATPAYWILDLELPQVEMEVTWWLREEIFPEWRAYMSHQMTILIQGER